MPKKPIPRESSIHGSLAFSELASTDPKATRTFLERTFAWSFESVAFPMGEYLSFRTPGGGRGGVRPAAPKEAPGSMNYVLVQDLDAATKKIKRAGGEIVLPRVDVPGMGSFFWFRVPGGPIMACWQDAPAATPEED